MPLFCVTACSVLLRSAVACSKLLPFCENQRRSSHAGCPFNVMLFMCPDPPLSRPALLPHVCLRVHAMRFCACAFVPLRPPANYFWCHLALRTLPPTLPMHIIYVRCAAEPLKTCISLWGTRSMKRCAHSGVHLPPLTFFRKKASSPAARAVLKGWGDHALPSPPPALAGRIYA